MIVVTTENIPGYRVVEVKGTTFGLIVRARGIGGDIMAGLRSVVGGEIKDTRCSWRTRANKRLTA